MTERYAFWIERSVTPSSKPIDHSEADLNNCSSSFISLSLSFFIFSSSFNNPKVSTLKSKQFYPGPLFSSSFFLDHSDLKGFIICSILDLLSRNSSNSFFYLSVTICKIEPTILNTALVYILEGSRFYLDSIWFLVLV